MKALVFYATRDARYEESADVKEKAGHVVLDVHSCGICGTDMHVYKGLPSGWPVPGIRGHEIAGTVSEIGAEVKSVKADDRVVVQPLLFCGHCPACNNGAPNLCYNTILVGGEIPGGFAEKVLVPEGAIFHVPDNLSLRDAACVETLATPVHAFRKYVSGINETAVIFGGGPQGLFVLQIARLNGISRIYLCDVLPHRLEIARQLGADLVFDSSQVDPIEEIKKLTDGYGVDLAIDTAGLPVTRQQLTHVLRRGGLGIFIAIGAEPTPLDFMVVGPGELRLCGSQCYTNSDFQIAINLLARKEVRVDPMVQAYPLSEGPAVFEKLATNPGKDIKVLLSNGK